MTEDSEMRTRKTWEFMCRFGYMNASCIDCGAHFTTDSNQPRWRSNTVGPRGIATQEHWTFNDLREELFSGTHEPDEYIETMVIAPDDTTMLKQLSWVLDNDD